MSWTDFFQSSCDCGEKPYDMGLLLYAISNADNPENAIDGWRNGRIDDSSFPIPKHPKKKYILV